MPSGMARRMSHRLELIPALVPFPCHGRIARRDDEGKGGAGAIACDAEGALALGATAWTLFGQGNVATSQVIRMSLTNEDVVRGCSNRLMTAPIPI